MPFLSRSVIAFGVFSLAHACYSTHEFSSITQSSLPSSLTSSSSAASELPLDIRIETLLSAVLICLGLVLEAPALKPISWRVWAGSIERSGDKGESGHPFQGLETRVGFLDIRKKRKEFAEWVAEQEPVKS